MKGHGIFMNDTICKLFSTFLDNLQLTAKQREDAQTKYTGVCKTLYPVFYDGTYTDDAKYLFGSYKTKTHIAPMCETQDVDVLFKIDDETYEQYKDNPAGLLQKIRHALKDRYKTTETIKVWGKVVLVQFSDNHHNVELLPALEQGNGTFLIPNTENGGTWEVFDPRSQVNSFSESNKDTDGKTRSLVQMMKKWVKETATLSYKSYCIVEDVIRFLDVVYDNEVSSVQYDKLVEGFLIFLENNTPAHLNSQKNHISTAKTRVVKAIELAAEGKNIAASREWRKVFGSYFPLAEKDEVVKSKPTSIVNPAKPWGWI